MPPPPAFAVGSLTEVAAIVNGPGVGSKRRKTRGGATRPGGRQARAAPRAADGRTVTTARLTTSIAFGRGKLLR